MVLGDGEAPQGDLVATLESGPDRKRGVSLFHSEIGSVVLYQRGSP